MAVNLTEHQLMIVKGMVDIAKATANQLLHIMENHGLDKVNGFKFSITIDPKWDLATKEIEIGCYSNHDDDDPNAGYCELSAGRKSYDYVPTGKNSPEYEWLFADDSLKERMRKILDAGTHPLPPDGLWVSSRDHSDHVDCGEWDINDSLS